MKGYKMLDAWSSTQSAKKWIVSLKHLSSYNCTVTNLLSIVTELARFTEAVYHYHEHRRSRRGGWRENGNGKYGLWNVEVYRKLQKYLFSVVLSKDSIFHSNSQGQLHKHACSRGVPTQSWVCMRVQ